MKLKNRKYLAESFEAFKNSKKEDPFSKDEELEDDASEIETDEDAEENAEEEAEIEAEIEGEEAQEEVEEEMEEEEAEEEAEEDAELNAELEQEEEDESDEMAPMGKPKDVEVTATFGLSTDTSSMMGGGMNGLTSFKRPEWAITRVMTDNGERVAMEYQNETECEVILGNLTYTEADSRSTEIAQQLNLSVFNSETDKYLGKVSSKVVRKDDSQKKTSYKY